MIGFFVRVALHNLHVLWNSFADTACIGHSPAPISQKSCSILITPTWILQRIGHLTIMRMMLQNSSKIPSIKQWDPILRAILNNLHIIGSWSGVSASREYRIMIARKSILIHIRPYIVLDKCTLILIWSYVARIQEELDSGTNYMIVVGVSLLDYREFAIVWEMLRVI